MRRAQPRRDDAGMGKTITLTVDGCFQANADRDEASEL
jgi:hypothetical protein